MDVARDFEQHSIALPDRIASVSLLIIHTLTTVTL